MVFGYIEGGLGSWFPWRSSWHNRGYPYCVVFSALLFRHPKCKHPHLWNLPTTFPWHNRIIAMPSDTLPTSPLARWRAVTEGRVLNTLSMVSRALGSRNDPMSTVGVRWAEWQAEQLQSIPLGNNNNNNNNAQVRVFARRTRADMVQHPFSNQSGEITSKWHCTLFWEKLIPGNVGGIQGRFEKVILEAF